MTNTYLGIDIKPAEQVVKYQDHKDAIRQAKKELLDDIMAKSEKTVISECVGNDPEGYIIMEKDMQAIRKKHLG